MDLVGIGLCGLAFAVLVGLICLAVVKLTAQSRANSKLPLLTVSSRVVAKRAYVGGGGNNMPAYTQYYVTFENESGERQEYYVPGQEFGLLAEGDHGFLSHQGTSYKGFSRQIAADKG